MTPTIKLTRRQAIATGAALPLAGMLTSTANSAADMMGPSSAAYSRFKLGEFDVTTLLAGSATRDGIDKIFGLNVSPEEFKAVSDENFIPTDKAQFYFTPTIVNTGSELVLFDTGLNGGGITNALASAGYSPE